MDAEQLWNLIHQRDYEFEIHTVTKNHQKPLWFAVRPAEEVLLIKPATFQKPSVSLSKERKIGLKEFERVHAFYDRWQDGEKGVRSKASNASKNTAYIFALIARFEEKVEG
ncbi:hypothetical protein [Lentibacillus sediminis]|uniref:hypothetical protein n=1 Tax=Lentibacillus sediminis TaxID=1940529 RepID=UPI000C1C0BE1|nr:hypothetical protein [Lentibacillus sediminis]